MDTSVFDRKVKERNRKQGRENFVKGMDFEFTILKREKKKALMGAAIRSAGSHSLIDIMAIRSNETRLISCRKNGTWLNREAKDLADFQASVKEGHNVYLAYKDNGKIKMDCVRDM